MLKTNYLISYNLSPRLPTPFGEQTLLLTLLKKLIKPVMLPIFPDSPGQSRPGKQHRIHNTEVKQKKKTPLYGHNYKNDSTNSHEA